MSVKRLRSVRRTIAVIMCGVMCMGFFPAENYISVNAAGPVSGIAMYGTTVSEAQTALEKAGALVEQKQTELDNAKKSVDEISKQLETAKQNVTLKEAELVKAQEVVGLGSYGYFQSRNSTDALSILTGKDIKSSYLKNSAPDGYLEYTKLGDSDDATSLDNMKQSIAWIKKCNSIRAAEGLAACTVNDTVMAMAQTNANYSATIRTHSKYYNIAENLAWGYAVVPGETGRKDPFAGWYDDEKVYYNNNVGSYDGAASMSAYDLSVKYPDFYKKVGHYLNIIKTGTPITGYGLRTSDRTHAQEFDTYSKTGTGVDVDTYEKEFLAYYNSVTGAVVSAENEISTAKEMISSLEEELVAANNAVSSSEAALTAAKASYTKAETDLAKAKEDAAATVKSGEKIATEVTVADAKDSKGNNEAVYKVLETNSASNDKDNSSESVKEVEYSGTSKDKKASTVTIKASIKGIEGETYKVTQIAKNTFKNNKYVKKVNIGSNVEVIGEGAFQNAKKLTTVNFGKRVSVIGKNAFNGCRKLKAVNINGNSIKKIGKNAFKGIKKNAVITISAKNKKTYNKVVKLIKKSGAKNVKYKYKRKK